MTISVAYQGERGAFSEAAAVRLLGREIEPVPCATFEDMFAAVDSNAADCCMAPIENSLAGSIHRNYDLLRASRLTIGGETHLRIVHNVIAPRSVALHAIRRIYSHPVALAQCTRFLRANPAIEAVPVHDTAGAVREVMERGRNDEAGIASADAAEIYGGHIVVPAVEDHAQNYTRFLLLTPKIAPSKRARCCVDGRRRSCSRSRTSQARSTARSARSRCSTSTSPRSNRARSKAGRGSTRSTWM